MLCDGSVNKLLVNYLCDDIMVDVIIIIIVENLMV